MSVGFSFALCWRRASLRWFLFGICLVGVTIFVYALIIHLYWVQFGVRQDHTIDYETKMKDSTRSIYLFSLYGGIHAFRGSVVSNLRELLKFSLTACSHFDMDCFLIAGTLLGAHREGKVFEWEEDADIGIMEEDFKKLSAISKSGQIKAFSNSQYSRGKDFDIIMRPGEDHIVARAVDRSSHLYVDFMLYQRNTNRFESPFSWAYVHCAHCETRKKERVKKLSMLLSDMFPLQPCTLEGMKTLCPHNITRYLDYFYGSDFMKVPVEFRFTTKIMLYILVFLLTYGSCKAIIICKGWGLPKSKRLKNHEITGKHVQV